MGGDFGYAIPSAFPDGEEDGDVDAPLQGVLPEGCVCCLYASALVDGTKNEVEAVRASDVVDMMDAILVLHHHGGGGTDVIHGEEVVDEVGVIVQSLPIYAVCFVHKIEAHLTKEEFFHLFLVAHEGASR